MGQPNPMQLRKWNSHGVKLKKSVSTRFISKNYFNINTMNRMNEILREFANSPFTIEELISMFDDFTPESERVFFAIGMYLSTKEIKEFNSQRDVRLTSVRC